MGASRVVVLGNTENRRVQLFCQAWQAAGGGRIDLVHWLEFLEDAQTLTRALAGGPCLLRIESPGENFLVEKALLSLGIGGDDAPGRASFSRAELDALPFQEGRVLALPQWYRGWSRALRQVAACLAHAPEAHPLNAPEEILVMFDKAACHRLLHAAGVPVPQLLGLPTSFAHLRALMQEHRCSRVFLKPRHTSSASGVVALEFGRDRLQAFSSAELVSEGAEWQLFNSLRPRQDEDAAAIAALVDTICREDCLAEEWFPKAGLDGLRLDLRVLVVAGQSAQAVVRQSRGPLTNLHLGNRRGDLARLRQRMGEAAWQEAMQVCQAAAAVFPRSLYVAVDLLISPSFRRCAVAEVNAFGDLLPNVLHEGRETYATELHHLAAQGRLHLAPHPRS